MEMEKEEFDNYNFSANTMIKLTEAGDWQSITSVNFYKRTIDSAFDGIIGYKEILYIKG